MSQWIPWLSHYVIHVEDIDHQHQELFRMLNELFDATWDGKGKDIITDCLKFLADYVVNHFKTEENYMMRHSFPGYIEHKKAHDDFTAEVSNFIRDYEKNGADTQLLVSVIGGLGVWTKDHIRDMDQDLGAFLSTGRIPERFIERAPAA